VLNIATAMFFMLLINWQLALLVLAVIPVLLAVAIFFRRRILVQFRQVRRINSKITGAYNENISGVRVVKALGREDENLREFNVLTSDMYRAGYRAAWLSALFLPAVQVISSVAIAAVIWYAGVEALNPSGLMAGLTIGGIQAFISYVTFMMWPIQDMARVYAEMQNSVASAERVFSLLDTQPDIVDLPQARDFGSVRGEVRFENVDFYYEQEKPVLADFNLAIRQGETIALVGATGGGKSTIVNLLSRFYEPKAGVVRINGVDYREMTMHALQSRIGMVLQTPHLFSGSIRENIRYGCLDASDAEIEAAARVAGAHDFISALPKGYDQEVGEGGVLLSVGQKQLISLARAVLADPEIFIMDEATSSVDTLTEALIQRGMEALMQGRTSVVIAHRLSTIRRADRIVVIEGGKIAEMGTHGELLRAQGHYYSLYTQQFRRETTFEHVAQELDAAPEPATGDQYRPA
jgi:ATP-binding cassette subfamily B protein